MLHPAEVYAAVAESSEDPAVRGWAEVSRLLADPTARLRFVPDDPDDGVLAAYLDPAGWWRLADLRRHAGLAVRLPPPASGSGRTISFGEDDLDALLAALPAGDVREGWADGGGGAFPELGLRGAARRRPASVTAALLADRSEPLARILKEWALRDDFRGGYAAGFLAAGARPRSAAAFVRAALGAAAPAAVEDVARLLLRDRAVGLAAGRRRLDEPGLAVAIALRVEPPERPALAALLAATGDPAAASALRALYAVEPNLPKRPIALFEGIVGRRLDAV